MRGGHGMALARQEARDELVAIINAGRELSPDHDYLLADIYLDLTRRRQPPPSRLQQWIQNPNLFRDLLGAAGLGLALLAFTLLAFAAIHRGGGFHDRE